MTNTESLWRDFARTKNPAAKEALIVYYAPLVKHVAGRLMMHIGQHVEFDDLCGYGVFGLLDAIDKFDYGKGVKFETYGSFRIRGAIIDHIRKLDWVPRTLRQKNKQLEQVTQLLEDELGRSPTEDEIAVKLNLTLLETRELIKKSSVLTLVSLDDYVDGNTESSFSSLVASRSEGPEDQAERRERQAMLADAISRLGDKEKLVVSLYYYEDLTLKEISSIMCVSESRVSQIHTKAISKLQGKLGKFKGMLFS